MIISLRHLYRMNKGEFFNNLFNRRRSTAISNRELFLSHVGQTSEAPLALEIVKAKGSTLWDVDGKTYIDLIAGISVCNIGHCHPRVVEAIKKQVDEYMHIMVLGELVESPQVAYAKKLTAELILNFITTKEELNHTFHQVHLLQIQELVFKYGFH